MTQKLKPLPQAIVFAFNPRFREYMQSNDAVLRVLQQRTDTATGDLLGRDDVSAVIQADSTAATVGDLVADFNALLAALRGL